MASATPADRPNVHNPGRGRHAKPLPEDAREPIPLDKALYRIPEVMRILSLSRSVIYEQIRLGRLRSVKEGSTRLIPAEAIADYVALLEAEAEAYQ